MVEKVVIIGGGSAGWMTATTLISQFPEMDVILAEAPNIPLVGVGESTLGGIRNWLSLVGIKDSDFMKDTDATYKLSIRFEDFYKKNDGGFHYPFGPVYDKETLSGKNDWYLKKLFYPDTPLQDYADCIFPQMALVNSHKLTDKTNLVPGFNLNLDAAFHFDAIKFGIWLRDHYCLPRGVKHINFAVKRVSMDNINDTGIEFIELQNGKKLHADLFIDCTGFKALLIDKELKEPFDSYEDILPNNSAWATKVYYEDKEKQYHPYTNCKAVENGWIWNIPLWSRMGIGYVYSDKYINDMDAVDQLAKNINNYMIEGKLLKMRVGLHRRIWVKNVCAIGLSAGFIEPLESNGLFTVHEFLLKLVRTLKRGKVSQWDKNSFNTSCVKFFRGFAEFVAMHYALTQRTDTEYWRDLHKKDWPMAGDFLLNSAARMEDYFFRSDGGFHAIATGMNYFPTDLPLLTYNKQISPERIKKDFEPYIKAMNERKEKWKELVKNEVSAFEYLRRIHDKV